MRILFLNPAYGKDFCKSARWFCKSRGRVQRHPDYLCEAIAVVEQAGHRCVFIDGAAKNIGFAETRRAMEDARPDMVVIQATTPSIYSDVAYARMAKDACGPDCLTVLVGAHVSAEPDDTLRKAASAVDIIARREYDHTLRDIASGAQRAAIAGISYLRGGEVAHNPDRPFIDDLDRLPFPAWRHIDPYDYHDAGKLYPFLTLMGGRGCSGQCTFCLFPGVMYGRRYRAKSPERFVAEIEYDLGLFPFLKEIMFEDDTLISAAQQERIRRICGLILEKDIRITWSGNARADLTDSATLKLMKRAGCRMLCAGFEFGSQQMLDAVKKGTRLGQMQEFARRCKEAGIRLHGCFMIGGPGETRRSALETIAFARGLPIDTAQFSGVCAYPGTEFYAWCKQNGFLTVNDWPEWVDVQREQRTIVSFPELSDAQINGLIDQGLKRFYLRPGQMLRMLSNIRSFADLKTKFYGLISFIDYFRRPHRPPARPEAAWNAFWSRPGSARFGNVSWSKRRMMRVLDRYVRPGMAVLDAGCGSGFFSRYFIDKGCRVYALDSAAEALQLARSRTGGKASAYLQRDLLDGSLPREFPAVFDIIFSDGLLEHFPLPEQERILDVFLRMKKADGLIVTFAPNLFSGWTLLRPFFLRGVKEKPFTAASLAALHRRCQASVVASGGLNVLPWKLSPEGIAGRLAGMLVYCVAR